MDWLKVARTIIYIGIFFVPFIALIVADWLYFPFITGKNFTFRLVIEVIFGLWIFVALYQKEYRPRFMLAYLLGGAFVVAIGISTLLAENPTKAFWSNFERMEGYITVLHLAAYVLVLTAMMRTEQLWKWFINTSLGVSTVLSLYGFLQLAGTLAINQGSVRIDATLGNATYFAVFMMFHAFLALYALMRWAGTNRVLQVVYGAIFFLDVLMVFYSATRGSILGLVGGLLLAGLIFIAIGASRQVKYVGAGILAVIVLLAGIFFSVRDAEFVRTHPVLERIASISLESGDTRFAIWGMALKGFQERPVFGWGQEGFNFLFNKYYTSELYTQEPWFDRAHDVFLDWLIAGGIVGALLYISLYLVLLWYLWRPGSAFDPTERAILTGLIAAYGFHNLFVFDNLMSYIMFFAVFSYITVRATPTTAQTSPDRVPVLPESTMAMAGPLILIATIAVVYAANASGYATASDLISGLKPHPEGVSRNLQYFIEANERGGLGSQEAGEQFLQFALQIRGQNVGDQAFQQDVANAARTAFLRVIEDSPDDARLLVFYGSFLRQYGDYAGARTTLDRALALSPEKQGILIERALTDYSDGKFDEALVQIEKVYQGAPDFPNVATLYAGTAIAAGETDLADTILQETFGTTEPNDLTILQSYIRVKQFTRALAIAERRLDADPSVDNYKLLAGTYLEAGRRADAIAALRRAAIAIPSFAAEAEQHIQSIQNGTL